MIDWSLIPEKVVLIARAKGFTTQNWIQEFFVVDDKLIAFACGLVVGFCLGVALWNFFLVSDDL